MLLIASDFIKFANACIYSAIIILINIIIDQILYENGKISSYNETNNMIHF
jgi:hypothetical protein